MRSLFLGIALALSSFFSCGIAHACGDSAEAYDAVRLARGAGHKAEDRKIFEELCDGQSSDPVLSVAFLLMHAQFDSITLAEIGTSEEELKKFESLDKKALAKKRLAELRSGQALEASLDVYIIRMDVKSKHFTLAEIGTSEEELTTFDRLDKIASAKKMLAELRSKQSLTAGLDVYIIRSNVNSKHFTLAEIGTSEEELNVFDRLDKVASAKRMLAELRSGRSSTVSLNVYLIRQYASNSHIALNDIGTNKEEIDSFK